MPLVPNGTLLLIVSCQSVCHIGYRSKGSIFEIASIVNPPAVGNYIYKSTAQTEFSENEQY